MTWARARLALLLLPIAMDCFLNMVVWQQSWRNTMSGEAWHHRDDPTWGWCYRFVDAIFRWQPNHCQVQAQREITYGSAWGAFAAEWRAAAPVTVEPAP